MLHLLLQAHSNLPALWIEQEPLTYQELFQKIQKLSCSFLQQGIRAEHRVAFIAETHLLSIIAFFALLEIGASPCLLSARIPQEKIPSYLKMARASFFLDLKTGALQKCSEEEALSEQAILLFTSGSSGSPKLVSLTVEHFLESAQGSIPKLGLSHKSCYLLSVPLSHVSGLCILFRTLLSGSSFAFTTDPLKGHPFVTHISWVPTQLLRTLTKESPFPLLQCALVGGAPISQHLVKRALEKEMPLYLTYGMTEMASQITMTSRADSLLPVHVGKPLPGREVALSSEGEILVKGLCLFTGYDTPSGVEKPLLDGGWFATGDLGIFDELGNLKHRGRKDNLFISGGENIYPEMIEKALGSIPGVLESLVVPLEDFEFGHRPVAFVHMEGMLLSKEEFHEKLTLELPRFCLPIHFLPFPLEENFKRKRSDFALLARRLVLQ